MGVRVAVEDSEISASRFASTGTTGGISHVLEHDLTGMNQVNAYFEQFVINHQHHFQRCPRCPRVNVGQGCGYLCVLLLFYIYYYALSPDYDGPKTSIVTLQSSMTPTTAPTRIVRL